MGEETIAVAAAAAIAIEYAAGERAQASKADEPNQKILAHDSLSVEGDGG